MNVSFLINAVKYKTIYHARHVKDSIIKTMMQPPVVKSIDDTIDKIISDRGSVSRFGSGEVEIILGYNLGFQDANLQLANRLKEILVSTDSNILICIPDVFQSLESYNEDARAYWMPYLFATRQAWYRLTNRQKTYYNAFMTRLYLDRKDKNKCAGWFKKLQEIWHERSVVIVEGYQSRLGVGNDLFNNARSIVRILAPAENAFTKYDAIFNAVKEQDKSKLILLALGPTATVLAYDLHKEGHQAIDIGHVDLEYEWFLRKATSKLKIPYKYVNEVPGGRQVEAICDCSYLQEIIAVI